MTVTWPWALLGLLGVPLIIVAHRRLLGRQDARRVELARQGLVLSPAPTSRWARLGPALLVAAFVVLVVAMTRPVASIAEPRREGTVVLAFDVSTSMSAPDVGPTRLEAAKAAARQVIDKQPPSVRLGVVAFGGTGLVTERPTTDKARVLAAVNRLAAGGETSLGGGMLGALSAIAGRPITKVGDAETGTETESDIGYYGGTSIVLLTDGENTTGPEPGDVAELASAAGVRIEPVGLGTPQGSVLHVDGFSIATSLDRTTLEHIADVTGGTYREAEDGASLAAIYDSIELSWTMRTVPHEVTSLVAALAALLLAAGATIAVLRQGRVV
ncbi:VWA domain-containing protein [Intrasporangium sp. DVR]|uniref:VWA domain-containing protein n=1 Tax=Intrasporangium sp. DVR TaxID=3127867 RepID=UPI00313A6690